MRLLAELIDPLAANTQQLNQLRAHAAAKNLGGLRGALRRIVDLRNLVGQLAENIARIASMTTAILETDAEIAERLLELAAAGVEDIKGPLQRPNVCARLLGRKAQLLEILDGRAGPDRAFLDRGGNLRRRLGQLDHGSRQGGRGRADRAEQLRDRLAELVCRLAQVAQRDAEAFGRLLDLGELAGEVLAEVGALAGVLDLPQRLLAGLADVGERALDLFGTLERDTLRDGGRGHSVCSEVPGIERRQLRRRRQCCAPDVEAFAKLDAR